MKIRTVEQFQERIDAERVWRIREIAALRSECFKPNSQDFVLKALRRSFIPIAYAHWEGFVTRSANYYLQYVAMQGLSLRQMSFQFMSLYLVQKCTKSLSQKRSYSLVEICDIILAQGSEAVHLNCDGVISTKSNLNSEVLKDICDTLGLNYSQFEIKKLFIDVSLLKKRNSIAHGDMQDIGPNDIDEIKTEIVNLIDIFKTEIENAIAQKKYQRSKVIPPQVNGFYK